MVKYKMKIHAYRNSFILSFVLLALTACYVPVSVTDVSDSTEYSSVIGDKFIMRQELLLIRETGGKYFLVREPGIEGRELRKIGQLPTGTLIKVVSVKKVRPSLFIGQDIVMNVCVLNTEWLAGNEIEVYSAFDLYKKTQSDPVLYILNPMFFQKIE